MGVELRPLGVTCNIACTYCYQDPLRKGGERRRTYDLGRMKAAVERAGGPFTLFGGEPLLVPLEDLEELWRWGLERYGSNSVQTNGSLITDEHLQLFERYRVHVGISIDGPGALNDARRNGDRARTRATTAAVEANIERLCRGGRPPSLIVTLHRGNATAEHLPAMHAWVRRMDALGVVAMRLHLLEVDDPKVRAALALTPAENLAALASFGAIEPTLSGLRFDVHGEQTKLLRGDDRHTSCVWRGCDPYTTEAVRGVEGDGQSSNCGRTNKDGVDFIKAAEAGYERSIALYHTPQAHGGCQGCRFFLMCKGHCPGTAEDGDWRNRSEDCEVWKALFTRTEAALVRAGETPLSLDPARPALEAQMVAAWARGHNPNLRALPRDAAPRPAPTMPRFARMSWVSEQARALWQPRVERLAAVRNRLALLAVTSGKAACAVTRAAPEQVHLLTLEAAAAGLVVERLAAVPHYYDYAPSVACQRTGVWLMIGAPALHLAYHRLRAAGDHAGLAALLGVPACCAAAHARLADHDDPTWSTACASVDHHSEASITSEGSLHTHGLLRRAGLATVLHHACSQNCAASHALGEELLALGHAAGYAAEMEHLRELLSLATSWSSLHAIAEVKTPLFKLITDAPPVAQRRTIQRRGATQVAARGRGVAGPYRLPVLTAAHP